jgi:hypothetical protein
LTSVIRFDGSHGQLRRVSPERVNKGLFLAADDHHPIEPG